MLLRAARHRDLPAIRALLAAEGLPLEDVEAHIATSLVAVRRGAVVGAGSLEPLGKVAMLRSVVIAPQVRGRGWGLRITERLLDSARQLGIGEIYLLTTSASRFFAARGFATVPREAAPDSVRRTRQFAMLCPSTAALMRRRLGSPTPVSAS